MARFPRTEAEIVTLAQTITSGLTDNIGIYPSPPVAPADLTRLVSRYTATKNCRCSNSGSG